MKKFLKFGFVITSLVLIILTGCKKDDLEPNGDCALGYSGTSCDDQITPTKIRISNILITSFPQYDEGSSWDIGSGPDLYIELHLGSTIIYKHPTYYENTTSTRDYEFSTSIDLTDVTAQYAIRLYDYDQDSVAHDFMGGILFYPYSNTGRFPTTINLDTGGAVTFELTVSYVW